MTLENFASKMRDLRASLLSASKAADVFQLIGELYTLLYEASKSEISDDHAMVACAPTLRAAFDALASIEAHMIATGQRSGLDDLSKKDRELLLLLNPNFGKALPGKG